MSSRIRTIALGLVVVAVVPYSALKLLWLGGSTIGLSDRAAVADIESTRMVVGNVVTIVLELLAVGLAVALTRPWGRRVPAWIVLSLAGGATGLLAPILLGLPLGSAIQLAARGDVRTSGMDEMDPGVFALTYGSFGLLAIALAVLVWHYALTRWEHVLAAPPRPPGTWATAAGALGMLPFGAAMVWWGLLGSGSAGPQAMDVPAQSTVLVVTGVLSLAGFLAPFLGATATRWPRAVWLVTWVGCATAALQGPAQMLLANGGNPTPAIALLTLVATPGSCVYGFLVLRGRLVEIGATDTGHNTELPIRSTSARSLATSDRPRGQEVGRACDSP